MQDARRRADEGWERTWGGTDTRDGHMGGEELAGNVGHVDEGKDLQGLHGPWRAGSARAGLGLLIDVV